MSKTQIEIMNNSLLDGYAAYQAELGAAIKTQKSHRGSLEFFSDYLSRFENRDLLTASHSDMAAFMCNWFPDTAMWPCKTEVYSYCAVFKKFYKWLSRAHDYPAESVNDIVATIKEEKELWIDLVDDGM